MCVQDRLSEREIWNKHHNSVKRKTRQCFLLINILRFAERNLNELGNHNYRSVVPVAGILELFNF